MRALHLQALPHCSVGVSVFQTLGSERHGVRSLQVLLHLILAFVISKPWGVAGGHTLPKLCFTSALGGFVFPPLWGAVRCLCHLFPVSFWVSEFPEEQERFWVLIRTAFGLFLFPDSEEERCTKRVASALRQRAAAALSVGSVPLPSLSLPGCPREQAIGTTGTTGLPAAVPRRSSPGQAVRRPPAPRRSSSGTWPAPEQPGQPPPSATPGARSCGRSCCHAQQRAPAAQTPRQPPGGSQLLRFPHFCPKGTRL